MIANRDLVYACFTHVPLWFDYPANVRTIYLGDSQGPDKLNLRDLAPEWDEHHPALGGSAGAFALKNYVAAQYPDAKRIAICQYRKFVSTDRIGTGDASYTTMDVVPRAAVGSLSLESVMNPGERDLLLCRPSTLLGEAGETLDYLLQYDYVHHAEDLLRFAAAAVEVGALERGEGSFFLKATTFFPGGLELGCFPADFWMRSMSAMETVVRRCVELHRQRRDGFQARAWSYCMERFGSYLLLKYLHSRYQDQAWPENIFGYLNAVVDDHDMKYHPGR